ncbi:MAG: inorganic phosphate transporter, partial [Syntrophaceae bacterium]
MTLSIILLIILALTFDFLNGFNDSANSIATIVSTRVLKPSQAVLWAAFFNFIAFLFFGLHVATTIGKGIIDIAIMDPHVIFATLVGACLWDLIAWYLGLPTSSSHALIGGMVGAALMKTGPQALIWTGIIKTVSFIFISPIVGLTFGLIIGTLVYWLFRKASPLGVDHVFRRGQLVSAAFYSLGHGGNDAQKTMGIIAGLLFSAGLIGPTFHIPFWVVLACQAAIALGTMFGGWRIVKTMGQKVAKLRPVDGFC